MNLITQQNSSVSQNTQAVAKIVPFQHYTVAVGKPER